MIIIGNSLYSVLIVGAEGQCNTSDAFKAQIQNHAILYDLMKKEEAVSEAIIA